MAPSRAKLIFSALALVIVAISVALAYRMNLFPDVVLGTNRSVTTTFTPTGNRSTSPVVGGNVSVIPPFTPTGNHSAGPVVAGNVSVITPFTPTGNRSTTDGPKPPRDSTLKAP